MDPERLFVHALDDLERRAAATDEYEVLMAAGLLRKLLMDAHPLVDQVNVNVRQGVSILNETETSDV